ncbi:ATP-binding cassette domain-containing protein [Streptomyces sp. NPDC048566]|uniref:ATP-binding cassette domain-containing protein n=1 Tax=Streptomyces sp. NPDC048566 TaxID=3365569 RepID=UPI00371208AF
MISATRLTVRHRRTTAVDSLDLHLEHGVHALLGPNGAGKSSLLRVLATADAAVEGELQLLGRDPRRPAERMEIRRRLGYLPQTFGMYRGFTVYECLNYAAWLKDMPGRGALEAVERAADQVGLTPHLNAKYRTLSGGTQRRVGIAQALVNSPGLLLLDEPTTGLDPAERDRFHALLRHVSATTTVVLATHLMEDVRACCDSVTVLCASRKVFTGSPGELEGAGGYAGVLAGGVR